MRRRRAAFLAVFLHLLALAAHLGGATAAGGSPWLTLNGNVPSIIAKGGFSGLFPDSSEDGYKFTYISGSSDAISWCDVQLTKDGLGICLPDILLDNFTNIKDVYPDRTKTYTVNGVQKSGWFSFDYDTTNLSQVVLVQGTYSRTNKFDANMYPILAVEDVAKLIKPPPPLWLNIQHGVIYKEKNLDMRTYLISLSKRVILSYVSSPEVALLRSIVSRFKGMKTKLIFRFLGQDTVEPTTNMTFGSLLKNLTYIKTFASGILVPKDYIWPVTSDGYLQPYTSVVLDAHKQGLEVYAYSFANDVSFSYNYSFDPLAEVLSFVDNGIFSVDGIVTDFPITASEALGCFSHVKPNASLEHGKPVIITQYGASGMYPDCTDLAYQQAIKDGADYIGCPVQVTADGTLICMSSINLMETTTVLSSTFSSRSSLISEFSDSPGIFAFNLTWKEIQDLKPAISNPEIKYQLYRNPQYKNAGSFFTLSDFLTFAKDKDIMGILIIVENAAFLAEKLGYNLASDVIRRLADLGYHNQTVKEVVIQSTNSSVLNKFKEETKYKLIYMVDEYVSDAVGSSITDMKQFAQAVAIRKESIFPVNEEFAIGQTDLVQKLQSAGLEVYAYVLSNEYDSQPWDFFSDPMVQINTYVKAAGVDGIITDFPATAAAYRRNTCSKLGNDAPIYMNPVQVGGLLGLMIPQVQPPALAPMPLLQTSDVVEPPLPSASMNESTPGMNAVPPAASHPSAAQQQNVASLILLLLGLVFGALLI